MNSFIPAMTDQESKNRIKSPATSRENGLKTLILVCCGLLWLCIRIQPASAEDDCLPPLVLPPVESFGATTNEESLFSPFLTHCDQSDWCWTFLPQGFLYTTYWASSAEPRLSVKVIEEETLGSLLDSSIAGRVGFVRFGSRNRLEGWQFDLLAGVNLRQDPESHLDMQATDYRYDLPLTYRNGPHAFKLGFYHVSSHRGDEYLVTNQTLERYNFLRDVFNFGYSYYPIPELRLYGEIGYGFNVDVSEPLEFQFGFDYGPAQATRIYGAPFAALNVHLREELNYGGNVAMQLGWAWRGFSKASGILRSGLYYYDGGSSQFSFYDQHESQIGWGLWYDF
ncbi:DUF1207 domain-containing protein [Thalassoglobus neptunius]|nr:DUF1207 domain-containing protein [Thalassoglobus neptunius]